MPILEPPVKRHILGKLPTHSKSDALGEHFDGIPASIIHSALITAGYVDPNTRRITEKARADGIVDICQKTQLWNLKKLEDLLVSGGIKARRVYANQTIKENTSQFPQFVSLTQISQYFNVSARTVGKWLDELGYRDENKLPKEQYVRAGLASIQTFQQSKRDKTVQFGLWDLTPTLHILKNAGHPLDFDYEKSLRATGRNSEVKVSSIDSRVAELAQEFAAKYNGRDKSGLKLLVKKTPDIMLTKLEQKLGKPAGWITRGKYLDSL